MISVGAFEILIVNSTNLSYLTPAMISIIPLLEIPSIVAVCGIIHFRTRRPQGRDILTEHHFKAVLRTGIRLSADIDTTGIPINVKPERIPDQLIVHLQNGAAVRFNDDLGILAGAACSCSAVSVIIQFITVRRSGKLRRSSRIDSRTDRAACRSAVFIYPLVAACLILLADINNCIIDRIAVPLRIERGIAVDCDRIARCLRQFRIRIPTGKNITGLGRNSRCDRLLCAVRYGFTADIGAAVGFVGQLEVLAGIVDVQFLTFRL